MMPLPVRKKFGISYIYHPFFSQQLGIFPPPPREVENAFYIWIYKNYRYTDMQLNAANKPEALHSMKILSRNNFLLDLHDPYEVLSQGFSKNNKRNISKAESNNLSYIQGIRLEDYLELKLSNLKVNPGNKEIRKLKSLIAIGQYKGIGEICGVYGSSNNLCAAVYFCRWKNRVIYFNAATSAEGKDSGAMFYLLDQYIKMMAGKDLILDLEGSMIDGVARFYSGFGAKPETYYQLKINRLFWPLNWFKSLKL